MKILALRLVGFMVIILVMLPFVVNQLHNRNIGGDILIAFQNNGPYTASVVVGPFCFWTVICTIALFGSFIFDNERVAQIAMLGLFASGLFGFIAFDIAVVLKGTLGPKFNLDSLFSSQTARFFLWGSILGAFIGVLSGFCMKTPSMLRTVRQEQEEGGSGI